MISSNFLDKQAQGIATSFERGWSTEKPSTVGQPRAQAKSLCGSMLTVRMGPLPAGISRALRKAMQFFWRGKRIFEALFFSELGIHLSEKLVVSCSSGRSGFRKRSRKRTSLPMCTNSE